MKMSSFVKWASLGIGVIIADQITKLIIRRSDGFYVCNQKAAFGLDIPGPLFWILWGVIAGIIAAAIWKKSLKENTVFLILILAGALSNFIDRIFLGCVVDFIDLGFWPAFNLADSAITIGALFLVVKYSKIL